MNNSIFIGLKTYSTLVKIHKVNCDTFVVKNLFNRLINVRQLLVSFVER